MGPWIVNKFNFKAWRGNKKCPKDSAFCRFSFCGKVNEARKAVSLIMTFKIFSLVLLSQASHSSISSTEKQTRGDQKRPYERYKWLFGPCLTFLILFLFSDNLLIVPRRFVIIMINIIWILWLTRLLFRLFFTKWRGNYFLWW